MSPLEFEALEPLWSYALVKSIWSY